MPSSHLVVRNARPADMPTIRRMVLRERMDPTQLKTENSLVAETVQAGLSAEAQAGLSPEETLPVIEQAITEGRTLRMTYWTAGREERTTRTVEPYRIEWRGDVPYLVGYCHARMDERVFRVDRIERLKVGKLES